MSSLNPILAGISSSARRMPMTDIKEFADRYVNVWNEPDSERRRETSG